MFPRLRKKFTKAIASTGPDLAWSYFDANLRHGETKRLAKLLVSHEVLLTSLAFGEYAPAHYDFAFAWDAWDVGMVYDIERGGVKLFLAEGKVSLLAENQRHAHELYNSEGRALLREWMDSLEENSRGW